MSHELQDARCDPAPEFQAREDGARRKLRLVLVLQGRRRSCLLTVDGPQLSEHESVEQRAHVQHRRLQVTNNDKSKRIKTSCRVDKKEPLSDREKKKKRERFVSVRPLTVLGNQ